jgi:hypothetical protein
MLCPNDDNTILDTKKCSPNDTASHARELESCRKRSFKMQPKNIPASSMHIIVIN